MKQALMPLLLAIIISQAVAMGTIIISPEILLPGPNHNQQTHNENSRGADEKKPTVEGMSLAVRVGKFIDEHNGLFNALATIVVAFFTFALWRATDKLWKAGENQLRLTGEVYERQSEDTKAQLAIAERSAETANVSAQAAITSNHLTQNVFISTQRPWIKCEFSVFGPLTYNVNGANIPIRFHIKNVGASPAKRLIIRPAVFVPKIGVRFQCKSNTDGYD